MLSGDNKITIEQVARENDLRIVERGFFRNKSGIARVEDKTGKKYILKTERIEPRQAQLFQIAKEIESELCFKVPAIIKSGREMIVMEEITGKSLNEFVDDKPDWVIEQSKRIADDYQKIIDKLLQTEKMGDLRKDGERWTMGSILTWGGPIVEAGLLRYDGIRNVADKMQSMINKKGEKFFGWAHGNIIGDHIIVSGEELYLLDLNIVPRVGRGYYDFIRAIDFAFLKTKNTWEFYNKTPNWLDKYLPNENREEVKLVLANRALGLLGWDVLFHQVEYIKGDLEEKKKLLLEMIKI